VKLHNHFLKEDLEQASKEFECVKDLLIAINDEVQSGNMEKAKHLSIDLTKSLHELSRLAEKKKKMDDINYYMKKLGTAQVIRMIVHAKNK